MQKQDSDRGTYVNTFDARGDLYNAASLIHATARDIERKILIEYLQLQSDHLICDVPAGGGYLADGIRSIVDQPNQIVCVEPSKKFSEPISPDFRLHISSISSIATEENYFDRIGSLAGLHHVDDKLPFLRESFRVLKPGGLIAIGDVMHGTDVARFLNGPVDQFSSSGHKGVFIGKSDFPSWFADVGLISHINCFREFFWIFKSLDQMVDYCKCLFGLVKATREDVSEALQSHFEIVEKDGHVLLPWSLIYGVGQKPSDLDAAVGPVSVVCE